MASIASKLARAAVACRVSPAAVGGCSRPVSPCLPRRLYQTGRRMGNTPAAYGFNIIVPDSGISHEEARQALTVTEEILESDEALWAMYEFWRKYYCVSRDPAEIDRRFEIFKRTARFVHKTNNNGNGYQVGMNVFADQTLQETHCPNPFINEKDIEEDYRVRSGPRSGP